MTTSLSVRDALWNACREKSCCRSTRVHVTGADLSRLMTTFELDAAAIVTAVAVDADDPAGFCLLPGGPRAELVLRKNGPVGRDGAPCVFLVETGDGHALCGAGDVAPTSCRAFPAVAGRNGVEVVGGACRCRHWLPAEIGDTETRRAEAAAAEESSDDAVIDDWNQRVAADGRPRTVEEFCSHLTQARSDSS